MTHSMSPTLALMVATLLSTAMTGANAEAVVFGGAEGSTYSSYAYLGAVSPFENHSLGKGWYQKAIVSMIRYSYESTERGAATDVTGRVPGLEAGIGHAWQFDRQTLDLSASVGYRHVSLSPFDPRSEKTGSVVTLNPQLMAYTPLGGQFDVDLLANYTIGLGSSFARLRYGYKRHDGIRMGLEGKRLEGRNYAIEAMGAFVAIPVQDRITLELTAGSQRPRDQSAAAYAGVAFSLVF